jgi:myo-inositol-1(or 4)-monophosphatase
MSAPDSLSELGADRTFGIEVLSAGTSLGELCADLLVRTLPPVEERKVGQRGRTHDMTDVDLIELRDLATELAVEAGAILRERAATGRSDVVAKSSMVDLVTDADRASEAFIVQSLRSRRPDDGMIGEEGATAVSKTGVDWVFDPLDGTTNFVYSIPMYAVSIGAVFDGEPVAGAIFNPVSDELYVGATGLGAMCNDVPMTANSIDSVSQALVATGFSYSSEQRREQAEVAVGLLPQVRDIRRCGSAALDLCNVASGRTDAYYERNVRPWDIAAGAVIAQEAGVTVGSLTSTPLVYSGGTDASSILAAAPLIYGELHALLADHPR